jgi:hypothetical protein
MDMGAISEIIEDVRFIFGYRRQLVPLQKALNQLAPKEGDMAPDFTLIDSSGTESVTLSDFRGEKPVALIFGSFT